MSIGLRLPPGVDSARLQGRLEELAAPALIQVDGVQPGFRSPKQTPLVPPFLRAIRTAGGSPRFTLKLGTSDMTVVGPAWNCPIVTYGPADASLDHTPQERMNLEHYGRAIQILRTSWYRYDGEKSQWPLPASVIPSRPARSARLLLASRGEVDPRRCRDRGIDVAPIFDRDLVLDLSSPHAPRQRARFRRCP